MPDPGAHGFIELALVFYIGLVLLLVLSITVQCGRLVLRQLRRRRVRRYLRQLHHDAYRAQRRAAERSA